MRICLDMLGALKMETIVFFFFQPYILMERHSLENYKKQNLYLNLLVLVKWVINPEHKRNGSGIKIRAQKCTKSFEYVHTLWPSNFTSRKLGSPNSGIKWAKKCLQGNIVYIFEKLKIT